MKKKLEMIDYSNPNNKHKMNELFTELMYKTKNYDKEMYDYAKMEVYEMAYGKKISQDCAEEWVEDMKPIGEHWDIEETTNAMQSLSYSCNATDYYVVANMMYNDYYDLVKDNEEMALKLAYNWLNDEDAKQDKLYEYWKYIIKRD